MGTLKDMATTVVFFDDAEGELQGYAERKNSDYYSYSDDSLYRPYMGRSIALGGANDAKLRLTLNLERKAKLSFWYANMDYDTSETAAISIDGTGQAQWKGDYNWSRLEYPLEAGAREIVWTKRYTRNSSSHKSYLSLDNILVVYTE